MPKLHVQPKSPPDNWHKQPCRLRVCHLLSIYSISQATLYRQINAGKIPGPTDFDPRPYWNSQSIAKHLA